MEKQTISSQYTRKECLKKVCKNNGALLNEFKPLKSEEKWKHSSKENNSVDKKEGVNLQSISENKGSKLERNLSEISNLNVMQKTKTVPSVSSDAMKSDVAPVLNSMFLKESKSSKSEPQSKKSMKRALKVQQQKGKLKIPSLNVNEIEEPGVQMDQSSGRNVTATDFAEKKMERDEEVSENLPKTKPHKETNKEKEVERFLKHTIGLYGVRAMPKIRGCFCAACNTSSVYSKTTLVRHEETSEHKTAVQNGWLLHRTKFEHRFCETCKIDYFVDWSLWKYHLHLEMHDFFTVRTECQPLIQNENNVIDRTNCKKNTIITLDENDKAGIIVFDLPEDVRTQRVLFQYFSDFGYPSNIEIGYPVKSAAKIVFGRSWIAENVVSCLIPNDWVLKQLSDNVCCEEVRDIPLPRDKQYKDKNNKKELEKFLKHIMGRYGVREMPKVRGCFCVPCNSTSLYTKATLVKHEETCEHETAMRKKTREHQSGKKAKFEYRFCETCKIDYFVDEYLWKYHLFLELHEFFTVKTVDPPLIQNQDNIIIRSNYKNHNIALDEKDKGIVIFDLPERLQTKRIVGMFFSDFGYIRSIEFGKPVKNAVKIVFDISWIAENVDSCQLPNYWVVKQLSKPA